MYGVGYDVKNIVRREEETLWKPSPIVSAIIGVVVSILNGYILAVCLTGF